MIIPGPVPVPPGLVALAGRPATPNSADDEFDGDGSSWTALGSVSGSAIDPYASFSSAACRRSINSYRKGWVMLQPPSDGGNYGLHKAVTMPTNGLFWARCSFGHRTASQASNDASISIVLSATSGGSPDFANNGVELWLNEGDSSVVQAQFDKITATTITTIGTNENAHQGAASALSYIGIHKISTTYHGWAWTESGQALYFGNSTHATAFDRVTLRVVNATGGSSPGNLILGFDFFRLNESATFLP